MFLGGADFTDKSDNRVGHLNTILARGGRNLNNPIFKSSSIVGDAKTKTDPLLRKF